MLGKIKASKATRVFKDNNHTYVFNYRQYLKRFRAKQALLAYLPEPVAQDLGGELIVRFSNSGLGLSWAQVLNELGYAVDIIAWDDTNFVPTKQYDLIVFHGGESFAKIMAHQVNKPQVIHFLTGSYWRFNNQREDQRREAFAKRHGVKLAPDRYIYASEDPVNKAADGIIVLGDPSMRDTFPATYPTVLTINNASYPDSHFDTAKKDYGTARNNFLFFAGSGNIHKGLDLLIEAFKDLPQHLYIVTVTEPDFLKVFAKELKLPNIHLVGEVGMRSPQFYEVMDKCAFAILPSCSEGQAGSVVECMNQGLIPIVSKETRLDARQYGKVLEHTTTTSIKQAVREMSSLSPAKVKNLSLKTRGTAIKEHSPDYFRDSLKTSIMYISKGSGSEK